MSLPPPEITRDYTVLLERAILNLRTRLRSGEAVAEDELIDYLSALENIPTMLLDYGKWHVEQNIDWHLAHYDEKWLNREGSQSRVSLLETLQRIRAGGFPMLSGGG